MTNFIQQFTHNLAYQNLYDTLHDKKIVAFGVQQNEKAVLLSGMERFILYVTSDYVQAQQLLRSLNALNGGGYAFLPASQDVLLYRQNLSKSKIAQRNLALYQMQNGFRGVVVCIESLLQPILSKEQFENNVICLCQDEQKEVLHLAKRLVKAGYTRVDKIEQMGDFSLRGDILDVFCPNGQYRLNFFGDFIESIFEIEDNANVRQVQKVVLLPLLYAGNTPKRILDKVAFEIENQKVNSDAKARLQTIFSELEVASGGESCDNAWLMPYVKTSRLVDYLPQNSLVVLDEPRRLQERVEFLYREHQVRFGALLQGGEVLPNHFDTLIPQEEVFRLSNDQLALQTINSASFFLPDKIVSFSSSPIPSYRSNIQKLAEDVADWKRYGYQVVICTGQFDVDLLTKELHERGVYPIKDQVLTENRADALLCQADFERGFVSHSNQVAVVGSRDIAGESSLTKTSKNTKQVFLSVEKGEYVVHEIHGIGLCEGIQKLTTSSGEQKDYFAVLYKGGDRLYVPIENSNLLSRYSGGEQPVLSKIGGEDFAKVKSKVKSSIKSMSFDLAKLYAEREKPRGFKYNVDAYLDEEFSATFEWTETEDQLKCIKEIDGDLKKDKIMDRLLVGDVGYGKTEVALRTAFKVVSNGKQVALMCPTTILAEQHFKTFETRLKYFGITVECLNRFRSTAEQKSIRQRLEKGQLDVVIGTHRLLSKDVKFANLGLLILDEEQRFGVEHKDKIKLLKKEVDVLTMSATPIPRTLHMALSGIRDISTITTPPKDRVAVATFVMEDSSAVLRDAILREVNRGGQVFFVYNEVERMDLFAKRLKDLVPEIKIITAHGQMEERALEQAITSFVNHKADLLLCSTIIENGIDLPNANTMIVYDADKLGLSQLYQLRGRVGRSDNLAYAYFVYRQDKILSETAYKRLNSIVEYSQLGSGFKIALKDLEIRGAGNVLGREQHGHMMKVGYDMYVKLLNESISEIKGEQIETPTTCTVEIDVGANAPESYIVSLEERMDFYQQLASCSSQEQMEKLKTTVVQTFGELPFETENLFAIAKLKLYAEKAGVCRVEFKKDKVVFRYCDKQKFLSKQVFDAISKYNQLVPSSTEMALVLDTEGFMQKQRLLALATKIVCLLSGEN